jgi:hypothetical protein
MHQKLKTFVEDNINNKHKENTKDIEEVKKN